MASTRIHGRKWPAAVLLALAAMIIGALFGSFHNGSAAITAKPINQTEPTIAGTPQQDQVLTAGNGTWTGTTPITFTYQWNRCDKDGKNCSKISGTNDNTYTVVKADVGNTLTVTVTGTNSEGNDVATSKATALVTATPPATGCPSGTGAIQIADLSSPATSRSTPAPRHRGSSRPVRSRSRSRSRSPRAGRPYGSVGLRDRSAVQPVLDPARASDRLERDGQPGDEPADRLPGVVEARAADRVRPGAQERRGRPRRHLRAPPRRVPGQPEITRHRAGPCVARRRGAGVRSAPDAELDRHDRDGLTS